ncbi:ILA [Symbiodinium microadriaticum]|nr:ILA [Symbiodinium microadriaticum]
MQDIMVAVRTASSNSSLLDIKHRVPFDEVARRISTGTVLSLDPRTPTEQRSFDDYIAYFKTKARAGVARLDDGLALYVMLLRFCQTAQEGLKNGNYEWLTHVRDVNATKMARRVMHALRWGKQDASHGLLFTKKIFYDRNSTLLLWSGVPASARKKWCTSLNAYMLESGDNDDIQTPFGSILERIRSEDSDEQLLQGCEWPEQEPIWQAASDAVVWRSGDSLVRFLVNKPLSGHGTLRESIFFRAELPTLARYPPTEGFRVLNEHPVVKCHHLMPVLRNKIESNGLLDDWRKVKTFSCVDVLTWQQSPMNLTESECKLLDSRAIEFLKPGEQLEPECSTRFFTLEGYKSCRDRGHIDFDTFQTVAHMLPPEYIPDITSLRLPMLSTSIEQLPVMLPDIVDMFDSSISLELCLWNSLETALVSRRQQAEKVLKKSFLPRELQAACRQGAGKLLSGLLKALDDSQAYVRQAAAEALGSMGKGAEEAVPKLWALSLNFSEDAQVQTQAAKALGPISNATRAVLPMLGKSLHDSNPEVRKRAAIALGLVGKEAQEAVPELLQTSLIDSNTAAEAVGSIGREAKAAVLPELLKALNDSRAYVRLRASKALWSMGEAVKEAVPELTKALNDSDLHVRYNAARTLASIGRGAREAVPKLVMTLNDSELRGEIDPSVRIAAAEALGAIGKEAKEAVPELAKALDDWHMEVRAAACSALKPMGKEAQEAVPQLLKALYDGRWWVQMHAADALGAIGKEAKEAVLPELRKALCDSGAHGGVRVHAAAALRHIGKKAKEAVPELMKALYDSEALVRAAAAEALGSMGREAKQAVPELMKALYDSEASVRSAAAEALGSMGREAKEAVPVLMKALYDSVSWVRRAAADALGSMGKEATEAVAELMKKLTDSDSRVRRAAAEALGSMGKEATEAVPKLAKALDDVEAEVRYRAADALGSIGKGATEAVQKLRRAAGDSDRRVRQSALSALTKLQGKVLLASLG